MSEVSDTLLSLFLPEGILDYFELTKAHKDAEGLHIHLQEKDLAPEGYERKLYSRKKDQKSASFHTYYIRLLERTVAQYFAPTFSLRDEQMFESASWIYDRTPNKKLIIWAHNGHLAKANIFKQARLGKYLYEKYGEQYYVIAIDFKHGEAEYMYSKVKNGDFRPFIIQKF